MNYIILYTTSLLSLSEGVGGGSFFEILLIVGVGVIAGFFNVVAAGGSLLTIPMLIFLGLPAIEANGTNRIAILGQNTLATGRYHKKKLIPYQFSIYLAVSAALGSIVGALIAVDINEQLFHRILAVVMTFFALMLLFSPKQKSTEPRITGKHKWLATIGFFFVGIYGGFLHAGIGVLMLVLLTGISHFSLQKANAIKIFVALVYVVVSLSIFIINGAVNWQYGIILAIGNMTGGWIGTQVVVNKGDKWIRIILIAIIIGMSIKLWFF